MIRSEDLPSINATLNGISTFLLLVGLFAIRRKRVRIHVSCMLSALLVSTAFLGSYSFYHFKIRGGQPTSFLGQGWIRPIYFTILFTHIPLAAIVPPLALYTAYNGFRGRIHRHVRIARWTFPIWLYVSITGVVVYWMLYRLYPPAP